MVRQIDSKLNLLHCIRIKKIVMAEANGKLIGERSELRLPFLNFFWHLFWFFFFFKWVWLFPCEKLKKPSSEFLPPLHFFFFLISRFKYKSQTNVKAREKKTVSIWMTERLKKRICRRLWSSGGSKVGSRA